MSNCLDTSQVRDDAEYWRLLAERVAANAIREAEGNGLDWLAHSRTSWVAVFLLVAGTFVLTMLSNENPSVSKASAQVEQALAPSDDVGRAVLQQNVPPAIGSLLIAGEGLR